MSFKTRIIQAGRITIPKNILNELELRIGDFVEVEIYPLEVRRKI